MLPIEENDAVKYAAIRNILFRKGKATEILANYEPSLHSVSEWWKQLYGESEGKDHKGLMPASVDLTTDLHSLGQFIQDGSRIMFETVLAVEENDRGNRCEGRAGRSGRTELSGRQEYGFRQQECHERNHACSYGWTGSEPDGEDPETGRVLSWDSLFYFFEFACGVSGYLLGVNPFNQPGVESYKTNMFALLGKPGYEEEREKLMKRL